MDKKLELVGFLLIALGIYGILTSMLVSISVKPLIKTAFLPYSLNIFSDSIFKYCLIRNTTEIVTKDILEVCNDFARNETQKLASSADTGLSEFNYINVLKWPVVSTILLISIAVVIVGSIIIIKNR